MTALKNEYRKLIEIIGDNYFGKWTKTRTACRGIVIRNQKLLLSYETATGQWMLPGGGMEAGEDEKECCIREVAEETGYRIRVSDLTRVLKRTETGCDSSDEKGGFRI